MEALKIVLLSMAAAIVYGILHDQVTARVCVEYFTIGHPDVFGANSPTLLAFGWGVLATWWVGLFLGLAVAAAARAGGRPKLTWRDLRRPITILMAICAVGALIAGTVGYAAGRAGMLLIEREWQAELPARAVVPFQADACAHLASYGIGFLGGLGVCAWAWSRRRTLWRAQKERGAA